MSNVSWYPNTSQERKNFFLRSFPMFVVFIKVRYSPVWKICHQTHMINSTEQLRLCTDCFVKRHISEEGLTVSAGSFYIP